MYNRRMRKAVSIMTVFILCVFTSFGYVAYKAGFFDVTDPAYVLLPFGNVERVCFLTIVCIIFVMMLLTIGDRGD